MSVTGAVPGRLLRAALDGDGPLDELSFWNAVVGAGVAGAVDDAGIALVLADVVAAFVAVAPGAAVRGDEVEPSTPLFPLAPCPLPSCFTALADC